MVKVEEIGAPNSLQGNILFVGQSEAIPMFSALADELSTADQQRRVGYVVSDSSAYEKYEKERAGNGIDETYVVKEWDITSQRNTLVDYSKLRLYEQSFGCPPGLFGAIVADRRLFMGPNCTFTQDYSRRFSDQELLSILQVAIERLEELFDAVMPQVLVGFICTTMMDYLAYLIARSRGIPCRNIRPTSVGDRVILGSTLNDPTPEFAASFSYFERNESEQPTFAESYYDRVRKKHGKYEGVVSASARPALQVDLGRSRLVGKVFRTVRNFISYLGGPARKDNHVPNPLLALIHAILINPVRAKLIAFKYRSRYVHVDSLKNRRFAFFPLHTEPEVSLLVYGRPFLNQIELIRQIAISMPIDMVLVVKEHPWMIGKRSISSYEKLLNIPRVHLAEPSTNARELILQSELVTVITGSIALESAIMGVPVLTFGDCPYNILPDAIVNRCSDLRKLPEFIEQALQTNLNDSEKKKALLAYLSAVYNTSESISLYSVLLRKKGVFSLSEQGYEAEIRKLADFLLRSIRESPVENSSLDTATW